MLLCPTGRGTAEGGTRRAARCFREEASVGMSETDALQVLSGPPGKNTTGCWGGRRAARQEPWVSEGLACPQALP